MLLPATVFIDVIYIVDSVEAVYVLPIVIGIMYFTGLPGLIGMFYLDDIFLRRDQCPSGRGSQNSRKAMDTMTTVVTLKGALLGRCI